MKTIIIELPNSCDKCKFLFDIGSKYDYCNLFDEILHNHKPCNKCEDKTKFDALIKEL